MSTCAVSMSDTDRALMSKLAWRGMKIYFFATEERDIYRMDMLEWSDIYPTTWLDPNVPYPAVEDLVILLDLRYGREGAEPVIRITTTDDVVVWEHADGFDSFLARCQP